MPLDLTRRRSVVPVKFRYMSAGPRTLKIFQTSLSNNGSKQCFQTTFENLCLIFHDLELDFWDVLVAVVEMFLMPAFQNKANKTRTTLDPGVGYEGGRTLPLAHPNCECLPTTPHDTDPLPPPEFTMFRMSVLIRDSLLLVFCCAGRNASPRPQYRN
mgnify:CR=1 FL=1